MNTRTIIRLITVVAAVLLIPIAAACSPGGPTTGPPGDSQITGKVQGIQRNASKYPYDMSFTVLSSDDVDKLPNPTKDRVGTNITASTNEDIHGLNPGDNFTANVKWALEPTKFDPIFYVYNVKITH